MGCIIGLIRWDKKPVSFQHTSKMLVSMAHRSPDGSGTWSDENVALASGSLFTTLESTTEAQPLVSADGSIVVVSDARIDNRIDLIGELFESLPKCKIVPDSAIILAAYQKWGQACFSRLIGDFAIAIWHVSSRKLICARDTAGVRSLYYIANERLFAFATEIKPLFELASFREEIDEEHIANFFVGDMSESTRTFFSGINSLAPRTFLTATPTSVSTSTYWEYDADFELTLSSDTQYEEAFYEVFAEAVRCRLNSEFPVGSFLSGGLDSSSIAGFAQREQSQSGKPPLHTFSAIFPSLSKQELAIIDERRFVEAVLAHGRFYHHYIRADLLNPLHDLEQTVSRISSPFAGFNMYMHRSIYKLARENGVRVILDGIDGDTAVSHGYELLPQLAKNFRLMSLLNETKAVSLRTLGERWTIKRILIDLAIKPLYPSLAVLNRTANNPASTDEILDTKFLERWDITKRLQGRAQNNEKFISARQSHLNGVLSPKHEFGLDIQNMESSTLGLDVRYPFYDRRLIELCLSLPADQKLRNGWSRSILRRSMRDIVPDEVRWRQGKSSLSPNFRNGMHNQAPKAIKLLERSGAASVPNSIVDLNALAKLAQNGHRQDWVTVFWGISTAMWLAQVNRRY